MDANKPVVAAFDFDGTITYRDSLLPFLMATFGRLKTLCGLALLAPLLLIDWLRGKSRQVMKERVLHYFVRGKSYEEMHREGSNFAKCIVINHIKPEALQRIRWHKSQGHRCILISASINLYIEPWGKETGFDDVLCSQVAVDRHGCLTGNLVGANCRAYEKVRRLEELIGDTSQFELFAYGDSKGDKELLEIADHAFYREMPTVKSS